MTGQVPLAVAQLLIQRIPALSATYYKSATAMTPILHTYTNASLALGNQEDPVLVLGQFAGRSCRGIAVPVLAFPLDAELFERALEVFGEGDLIGRLFVRLLPADGGASRWGDEEVAFGGGRTEVEGRLEDGALVVRVDVVEAIWRGPAELDRDEHGVCTAENAEGDFGGGCGWREEVSIARLTGTFRVVGVVKYDNCAFKRF